MVSPALTATTALTTDFDSNISINESTIDDGDSILLGTSSVATSYINSIHDTMSTIDRLSDCNSNNNESSNQAEYSASYQESQSQSQSQSMGTAADYQPPLPSCVTSVVGTNNSVLLNNFSNTSNYGSMEF